MSAIDKRARELTDKLRDEALRLSSRSLDQGCAASGVAANLADSAADTIDELLAFARTISAEREGEVARLTADKQMLWGQLQRSREFVEEYKADRDRLQAELATAREALEPWLAAYDAYYTASDTYNARLAYVQAEREKSDAGWTLRADHEYRVLNDTQRAAQAADHILYKALRLTPHEPQGEKA